MSNSNFSQKLINLGPLILLYYLSISETDTHFQDYFEIFSFNLQLIIVYFWVLKSPTLLSNGHIFFAGLINDVVLGFPLGLSSLIYLLVAFIGTYIKNMSVHTSLSSDWFTFLIALIFSNLTFGILVSNFSEIQITATEISYNTFFTLMFFPIFWFLFSYYNSLIRVNRNA
jgi:rod shape-determining protein MreD